MKRKHVLLITTVLLVFSTMFYCKVRSNSDLTALIDNNVEAISNPFDFLQKIRDAKYEYQSSRKWDEMPEWDTSKQLVCTYRNGPKAMFNVEIGELLHDVMNKLKNNISSESSSQNTTYIRTNDGVEYKFELMDCHKKVCKKTSDLRDEECKPIKKWEICATNCKHE